MTMFETFLQPSTSVAVNPALTASEPHNDLGESRHADNKPERRAATCSLPQVRLFSFTAISATAWEQSLWLPKSRAFHETARRENSAARQPVNFMKRILVLLFALLASFVCGQARLGVVQHCLYDDEARAIRERALVDELGFVCVRSSFDPWQLAWVKPDATVQIGNYGKKCMDLAWKYWANLEVFLSIEVSDRLTDKQNDTINAELIAYAYQKGVRSFILLNEPSEWSQGINSSSERWKVWWKVQRLIILIHELAPGSRIYGPALHGWYGGMNATDELNRNVARADQLWQTEGWLRSIGRPMNVYTATGSTVTKVKALRPSLVSEIARRPGSPFITKSEIDQVRALPVDAVFVYCLSNHPGYQLMTASGVRDEARIRALK